MNALDICNNCDVTESDPDSPAGYCAECEAEVRSGIEMVERIQRSRCGNCGSRSHTYCNR